MKISLISWCLVLLVLSGCGYETRPDAAALHDLGLIMQRNGEQPGVLQIEVIAPVWLRDTRIRYRQLHLTPTIVKFYNLDRWIAQPAALITKHFAAISVSKPLTVKVRLLDFEQRFDAPKQARSVIAFEVEVYKANENVPTARKTFQYEQINMTANALGAINSFADLTGKAVIEVTEWLNSLL